MAANISNRTSDSSYEEMMPRHSTSECIPWLVVLITECLAIVILNLITIIVFVKKRQLQRRIKYLIINLAIVDLLVGAVSGPLQTEYTMARFCNMWRFSGNWSFYLKQAFAHLFPFTSLANLVAISLDRLHATFCPLRHRFVKKWVSIVIIIIVIWLTTTAREAAHIVLFEVTSGNTKLIKMILYIPFYFISLLVICVSYSLIVIKVRCSRHPQFHGLAKRERKLTGTLLVVALASLLCFLPALTLVILFRFNPLVGSIHIYMAVLVAFLANSLINPVIYALRIPVFRAGVSQIFYRAPNRVLNATDLPLRNLRRT